jgi:hypothetical protein
MEVEPFFSVMLNNVVLFHFQTVVLGWWVSMEMFKVSNTFYSSQHSLIQHTVE